MTRFSLFDCALPAAALKCLEAPLAAGQLAAGPSVSQLEQRLAPWFAGREVVAMGDMTNALAMALRLAGVRAGDEVLTLSFNCMSSNTALAMVGAKAVWVDVDPATASFDPDHASRQITRRTRAVAAYHVSGYPADLAAIRQLCDEHGLPLIEDANNAFGAGFAGQSVGTFGDFAVLSFYANRQVNAIDGGAVVCRRGDDAARGRNLRRFGIDVTRFRDADGEISPALDVAEIGTSSSLDNIRATFALASLDDVDDRISRSRRNAAALRDAAPELGLQPIAGVAGAEPAYWTWLLRVRQRDAFMRALKAAGIGCSKLHYPNHHYSGFGSQAGDLPGTMLIQDEMLAIPCGWWLDAERIGAMVEIMHHAARATR